MTQDKNFNSKKYIKSDNDEDNNNGEQRYQERITEEQRQKADAESQFEQKYNEKTKKRKKPRTKKDDIEEPKSDEEEIGSHKKTKGQKKFFSFLKDLQRRSTWKKIIFNLRNLFRTKASLEEEISKNIKLLKIKSAFGFKSKSEEKQLTVRIAYLLQELSKLDRNQQALKTLTKEFNKFTSLIALTENYLKSPAKSREVVKEHITSQVAQTHSTTTDKQKYIESKNITVEFNKQYDKNTQVGTDSSKAIVHHHHPQAYVMQQPPQFIPISSSNSVALGLMGGIFSTIQAQLSQAVTAIKGRLQDLMNVGGAQGANIMFAPMMTSNQSNFSINAMQRERNIVETSCKVTFNIQYHHTPPPFTVSEIMVEAQQQEKKTTV